MYECVAENGVGDEVSAQAELAVYEGNFSFLICFYHFFRFSLFVHIFFNVFLRAKLFFNSLIPSLTHKCFFVCLISVKIMFIC